MVVRTLERAIDGRVSAERVVGTSLLVDLSDVVLNLIVAIVTGSVTMLAETLQGLSDFVAALFLYIGIKRARRPAHADHPFGHGRELYLFTLLSSLVMLTITSTFSLYFGWQRLLEPQPIERTPLALGLLVFAILSNGYAFSLSVRRLRQGPGPRRLSKRFFASPLIETKTTTALDLLGTLSAILGLIALGVFALTGDSRFDGLGAMLIGVLVALFGLLLVLGNRELIVGQKLSDAAERKIREMVHGEPEVKDVLDLRTLIVGPEGALVDLDIFVDHRLPARQVERLIDRIKDRVKQSVGGVAYVQVELETPSDGHRKREVIR